MDKPSKPDWTCWLNLPDVELSAAVELSVDVAPGWFSRIESERYHPVDHEGLRREIATRIQIARAHARSGVLNVEHRSTELNFLSGSMGDSYGVVKLPDFRAWGESLAAPLTFPAEFPEATQPTDSTPSEKPLTTMERETLLAMVAVLCELSGFDLRKETKGFAEAAKLKHELERRSVKLTPQTVAGKIASGRELIAPKGPVRLEFK